MPARAAHECLTEFKGLKRLKAHCTLTPTYAWAISASLSLEGEFTSFETG
jgi:hypothetical protein